MSFSTSDNSNMPALAPPRSWLKCAAIACFIAAPFACAWTIVKTLPAPPPEHVEKAALFDRRAKVDTVIVGDSRVRGIAEEPFAAKGWNYFNMGLGGISPEDMAMQLKYALLHGDIRRVVIGVSLEGMTARYPFEFSRYHSTGPFASAEIVGFATVDAGPRPAQNRSIGVRRFLNDRLLPIEQANVRLRWFVAQKLGRDMANFMPNGTMDQKNIREMIAAGDYNFARERDPNIYFNREDSEPRYLAKPELAPFEEQLYRKVFAALRQDKIVCVVFETGRTAEYQKMIDADPKLARVQAQWRAFFQSESHDGVKFLDKSATRDCYDDADFFDAVHFIGKTGDCLAVRLADALAALEKR
jgi:hypothetical protein